MLLELRGNVDAHKIIMGELNTSLTDRPKNQKVNREIVELTQIIGLMDLVDIYRTLHPIDA